jgi:hypothetical protein
MAEPLAERDAPRPGRAPRQALLASAALALLAAACGGEPEASDRGVPAAAGDQAPGPERAMSADAIPEGLVAVARADLARRIGVAQDEIEVVSVREVTWPDGAIGCPQPGMAYTQALVNGSQIILRHGRSDYHYHAGGARGPFYCANPRPPVPEGAGGGDR